MKSPKPVLVAVACVICFTCPVSLGQAPQPQPGPQVEEQTATTDPLLLRPPKTQEDIEARLKLARERLEALKPTTQPATQPADESQALTLRAYTALFEAWCAYHTQLQRIVQLREAQTTLASEQRMQELSRRIEELNEKTAQLRRQPSPITAAEEQVEESAARYREWDVQLVSLSELQTRRAGQIATGFKQQREGIEAELKDARQKLQQVQATINAGTATAPAEQERFELERRRLNVGIARRELALAVLGMEGEQTQLAVKQDEQYLDVVREYVVALRQRMNALTEAKSRGTLEVLELRRRSATQPHEVALLDLQHFRERLLLTRFQNKRLLNAIKDRFPANAADRLRDRVASSAATWENLVASLEQRTRQEAMELRGEVRQDRKSYEQELARLEAKLGETLAESHELQRVRDRANQRLRELAGLLASTLETVEAGERARLATEATSLRTSAEAAMAATLGEVGEVVERVNEATALVRDHVSKLRRMEDQLYRTALTRRESGVAGLEWAVIREEFRQLAMRPPTPPSPAPDTVEMALFPAAPRVRQALEQNLGVFAADFRAVPGRTWALFAGSLVVTVVLAAWLRWHAKKRAVRLIAASATHPRDVDGPAQGRQASTRFPLLGWKLVRNWSIPLAVGVVCWAAARLLALSSPTRAASIALVAFLVILVLAIALARDLFEARDGVRRVVRCSDAVARHWQYWLVAMLVFSAAVLLVPLFLRLIDVAPGIRSLLWEVFKAGILLMLVLFAVRKSLVLGGPGAEQRHWTWVLASALYPLPLLGVLALLILQIVGYGVLVEFVGTGVLATLGVLIAVGVVVEYLCDVLDRYPGVKAASLGAGPGEAPGGSAHAAGPKPEREAAGESGHVAHFLRLVKLLLRLAGIVCVLVLTLRVWGLSWYYTTLDWKLVGLGGLIVVIALLVDRVVVSALHTLHVSGRMPQSTANIMRRWVRGLLSLVVLLSVIALTGYQINNIWTFLTTLLAMVAIGFVAVWSILGNVTSTLIVLIWRPFNVGEHIEIQPEGIGGEVIDINFMYTLLKTEAGERITVPNSQFMQKFIRRKPTKRKSKRTLSEQLEASTPLDE